MISSAILDSDSTKSLVSCPRISGNAEVAAIGKSHRTLCRVRDPLRVQHDATHSSEPNTDSHVPAPPVNTNATDYGGPQCLRTFPPPAYRPMLQASGDHRGRCRTTDCLRNECIDQRGFPPIPRGHKSTSKPAKFCLAAPVNDSVLLANRAQIPCRKVMYPFSPSDSQLI